MFRRVLQFVGVLFVAEVVLAVGALAYFRFAPAADQADAREMSEFDYILNWAGLDPEQPYEHIASEQQVPAWNGDYTKWACLQMSDISAIQTRDGWRDGEEESELFSRMRTSAAAAADYDECFGGEDINTKNIEAYFWSLSLRGRTDLEGATVIFIQKSTKRLLYVDWMS